MLLKYSQAEKKLKTNGAGKQQRTTGVGAMKLTLGTALPPRLHRRAGKGVALKRPAAGRSCIAPTVDPCENSNDSGLGFDHHADYQLAARTAPRYIDREVPWTNEYPEVKRKKLDIKLETDDANANFTFPEMISRSRKDMQLSGSTLTSAAGEAGRGVPSAAGRNAGGGVRAAGQRTTQVARPLALTGRRAATGPVSLSTQLGAATLDGRVQLHIVQQPEAQHRARYQTEGSRGAVKDRSGNGFPVVQLSGYNKPATLQVFIGTDMGRVAPHMFYQACRVSGKNSTPCVEKKIDGTIVIEVDFDPSKDMVVTCDCVGILKERNVDVEHRFPDQSGTRNKKKSTRCRMVFRTTVTHEDGSTEILQAASLPIVCTQPPGVPEICKKSTSTVSCTGGCELFILGKNFLKDSKVLFQEIGTEPCWKEEVTPDKEFLQQTHLVCTVPPYRRLDITEPVTVKLAVLSSGKMSEPHTFTYLPITNPVIAAALQTPVRTSEVVQPPATLVQAGGTPRVDMSRVYAKSASGGLLMMPSGPVMKTGPMMTEFKNRYLSVNTLRGAETKQVHPTTMMWTGTSVTTTQEDKKMESEQKMPPPVLMELVARQLSANAQLTVPEVTNLKMERRDDSSEKELIQGIDLSKKSGASGAELANTQSPNVTSFCHFVSQDSPLPLLPAQSAQSVEKYLSRIENVKESEPRLPGYELPKVGKSGSSAAITLPPELGGEKSLSQFDSRPSIFEALQQQNVLSGRQVPQKVNYISDFPISSVYDMESTSKLDSPTPAEGNRASQPSHASQLLTQVGPQPQTLQEAMVQSSSLRDAVGRSLQSQCLRETLSQSQQLAEAIVQNTLQESLAQTQPMQDAVLQNTRPQAQSLPEAIERVVARSQSLEEALNQPQSLREVVSQEALEQSNSLEEAMARNALMTVGNLAPKQIFEDSTVQEIRDRQSLIGSDSISSGCRVAVSTESQVNGARLTSRFQDTSLQRQLSESQSVSQVMTTLSEQRVVLQPPTSLMFCGSQQLQTGSSVCTEVKSDSPVVESMGNNQIRSPVSEAQLTENSHGPVLGTQMHCVDGGVSAQSPSSTLLLNRANQCLVESTGLQSLTSAMDNQYRSSTEKLDAIVNSAADSHMGTRNSTTVGVNTMLGGQIQNVTGNEQSSGVLVSSMRLEPSLNTFNINSLQPVQNSVEISHENMMLNDAVSAAIDKHISIQDAERKQAEVLNHNVLLDSDLPTTTASLSVSTPSTTNTVLMKSPHTSPIAMKNIILNPPTTTSAETHVLVNSPTNTSPIAVKAMILNSPIQQDICMTNVNAMSPIAVKSMILESSPMEGELCVSVSTRAPTIAIKEIMNSQLSGSEVSSGAVSPINVLGNKNNSIELVDCGSCTSATPSVTMSTPSLCSLLNRNENNNSLVQQPQLILPQTSSSSLQPKADISSTTTQLENVQARSESRSDILGQVHDVATSSLAQQVQRSTLLNSIFHSENHQHAFDRDSSVIVESVTDRPAVTQPESTNVTSASRSEVTVCDLPHSKTPSGVNLENGSGIASNHILTRMPDVEKNDLEVVGTHTTGVKSSGSYSCSVDVRLEVSCSSTNSVSTTVASDQPLEQPPLPLPVTEISSSATQPKTVPSGGPLQKKAEEGMVPQELTQMSESDLISYINPSCFDQV